jgi:thiol-disulfide isomerase/thioredoxin
MQLLPGRARAGVGRILLLSILAASADSLRSTASEPPRLPATPLQDVRPSLEGATGWINSDGPIHLEKLRGKVVLLDFWTYCCVNCHHVLPHLAALEKKYKNQLVVIGVHSPKFEAEKDTENIRDKVREYQIKHPVANDANQVIWGRFGVNSWPTIVAIDANGIQRYQESGEGQPGLDREIESLVERHRSRRELDETPIEFPAEAEKPHDGGLLYPGKVTSDAGSKRLYISDTGHNRIVVTDLEGKFLEAIGSGKPGLVDGDYKAAGFDRPQGTCLLDDILYVADTENHALRAVDLRAKSVKTVAGDGQRSNSRTPQGKGTATPLNSPWDVIPFPGTKMLAIAMAGPHQIWRFDVARGTVGHWAGSGTENLLDGTLAAARFAQPSGLATDGTHLYVADAEVSGVRSISLGAQHRVSTIVGTGLFVNGDQDGRADAVRLQHCLGLAFGDGKLYIADTYNNKIKVCDPRNRTVETLVGGIARGMLDDPPRFNEPGGLSLSGSTLYVADTNNHAIRAVEVESRKVRTLDLSTVKPPVRTRSTSFPNPTVFNLAPVHAMPGREVTLEVAIPLPPGFKLSVEAPINYLAEADPPGSFATEVSPTGQKLAEPAREFAVKLPLARQARTGSTMTVKFSVSAFVCLPNSLCTVKNYVWNVPITFQPGNSSVVKLSAAQ